MANGNKNPETKTRSERINADITALLRARYTLLWLISREELRVERALVEAAGAAKFQVRFWDCSSGLNTADGNPISVRPVSDSESQFTVEKAINERTIALCDPSAILNAISKVRDRCVYVLRDLNDWLDPVARRAVRNLAKSLQSARPGEERTIVILTTSAEVPPQLAGHCTVLDYPLPDRREIEKLLDEVIAVQPEAIRATAAVNGAREAAIDAAVGLEEEEASNCFAKSLVTVKRIDAATVASEKRRVIAREKVLTWIDPDPRGMNAVAGLRGLKRWLELRLAAFTMKAREFGLPAPKGILLLGPPGTGKSLTAKAVATAWGMPLLRLDLGALKSKWVGESEANIRKALAVAEAVAPCVLWLDEIEKALAGSTGPQGDGGVGADALGAILSWMQERQGTVFVVATANDVSALPPELLRKGRFDEIFFVDLPTATERLEILRVSLKQLGREIADSDLVPVAAATEGFTGAEIAGMIPDALFEAFNDSARALTGDDLLAAAETVVPISRIAAEKVEKLREWAKGRARPASEEPTAKVAKVVPKGRRVLDL